LVDGLRVQCAVQENDPGARGRHWRRPAGAGGVERDGAPAGDAREFFKDTKAVLATMADQPGLLGHAVRFEIFGNKAWTMTAWKDEASLTAFVRSPAHREAVRRSGETAQNIRFGVGRSAVGGIAVELGRGAAVARCGEFLFGGFQGRTPGKWTTSLTFTSIKPESLP